MSKCILINAAARTVSREDMPKNLGEMQAMVGGDISVGTGLKNGDILYVDEEADCRSPRARMFTIAGCRLRGNAVVVSIGPKSGKDCNPKSTLDAITAAVAF